MKPRKMTHTLWTTLEKAMLRGMLGKNLTLEEIGKCLGKTRESVARMSNRMGLKNDNPQRKYTDDFKKIVYEFYINSNAKETKEKFCLSQGTLEAFVTRVRKIENIKDQPKKNEWSQEEVVFLLEYIGLQPLSFIAEKLDRTEPSIKSYLKRKGFRLHYVNGLPKDEIDKHFRPMMHIPFLRVRSGEIILPWTTAEENLENLDIDIIQRKIIISMACFQRFLHGVSSNKEMTEKLFEKVTE